MTKESLHQLACEAQQNAYAPYSNHLIGSALRLSNGSVASGANMENASYGATVCAERVAIWKALSENPGARIEEIVVVSDQAHPWPPCGMCRQVISEFATSETLVHIGDLQKIRQTFRFGELFPSGFGPQNLQG